MAYKGAKLCPECRHPMSLCAMSDELWDELLDGMTEGQLADMEANDMAGIPNGFTLPKDTYYCPKCGVVVTIK
jgi:hypothetical protein